MGSNTQCAWAQAVAWPSAHARSSGASGNPMAKKKLEAGEFFMSSTWINITVTLFPKDELNHL